MLEKERIAPSSRLSFNIFLKTLCYYLASIYILGFTISALGLGSRTSYTLVQIIAAIIVITKFSKPRSISIAKLAIIAQIYVLGYLLFFWNYDLSWDGNAYHGSIINRLLAGWNMFTQTTSPDRTKAFVENYVKNTEILSALFGAPFGLMDFGRIAKVLFIELCGASAFIFARKFLKFAVIPSAFFAAAAVFNPVLIGQILTGYIDDIFYLTIASMIFLWLSDMEYLALILFAFSIGIKSSALFLSTSVLLGLVLVRIFILKERKIALKLRSLAIFVIIFCTSLSFYVFNFITKGHPLYPTKEMNVVTNIHAPASIRSYGNIGRFLISNLSFPGSLVHVEPKGDESFADILSMGLERYTQLPEYSLSFSLYQTFPDCRINGFGVFWPMLLLISTVILLSAISQWIIKKGEIAGDKPSQAILLISALVYLTALVFPAGWWARLVAHLWLVPLLVAGFLGRSVFKSSRAIALAFFAVMILNSAPSTYFVGRVNDAKNRILKNYIESARKIAKEQGRNVVYEWIYRYELEFADERVKFGLRDLDLKFMRVERAKDFVDACQDKKAFSIPLFVVPPPPMWCM